MYRAFHPCRHKIQNCSRNPAISDTIPSVLHVLTFWTFHHLRSYHCRHTSWSQRCCCQVNCQTGNPASAPDTLHKMPDGNHNRHSENCWYTYSYKYFLRLWVLLLLPCQCCTLPHSLYFLSPVFLHCVPPKISFRLQHCLSGRPAGPHNRHTKESVSFVCCKCQFFLRFFYRDAQLFS